MEIRSKIPKGTTTSSLRVRYLVALKFGKVTDTLQIYPTKSFGYRDFWNEVSVTSRSNRKIDHYPLSC